uniref:Uncharacterized protein n=1 Tax=Trichuris muris TaxID=70415 RepID=A0A5S6QTE8_TRIMR
MDIRCRSRWKRNVWHNGNVYMGKGLLILVQENELLKSILRVKIYCIEKTEDVQIVFKTFRVKTSDGKKKKTLYKITEYIMKGKKKIQVRVQCDEKLEEETCENEPWNYHIGNMRFNMGESERASVRESTL